MKKVRESTVHFMLYTNGVLTLTIQDICEVSFHRDMLLTPVGSQISESLSSCQVANETWMRPVGKVEGEKDSRDDWIESSAKQSLNLTRGAGALHS